MSGPNQLLSELTTPDIPREWAAIATNPLEPGLPEEERLKVLKEAALDAAEDARLHPKIVLDKEGLPHRAAEYGSVFSFQGELVDGPMTAVIIETDRTKMLLKQDTTPEGETVFSFIDTERALKQIIAGEPIAPLMLPKEIVERSLAVPGMPLTLGNPKKGTLLRREGRVTRITGVQMDETGRTQTSMNVFYKNTEHVTDARDAFNAEIRSIRQTGVAPYTGRIATAEAVPSSDKRLPVSPSARLAEQEAERMLARERAKQAAAEKHRGETIQQGLTDLSYAITDRLINSEGVRAVADTESDAEGLKSVYKGTFTPKAEQVESDKKKAKQELQVTLVVFDDPTAKAEYRLSNHNGRMQVAWTSAINTEGSLSVNRTYGLDGRNTQQLEEYFEKTQHALQEYDLTDDANLDEIV